MSFLRSHIDDAWAATTGTLVVSIVVAGCSPTDGASSFGFDGLGDRAPSNASGMPSRQAFPGTSLQDVTPRAAPELLQSDRFSLGVVERFETSGAMHVRPVFTKGKNSNASRLGARVELPTRASGTVRLEEPVSGVRIEFTLLDAGDSPLELKDGLAVYPHALPGRTTLLHRTTPQGTEDFALFSERPEHEVLRYRVRLAHVAGLRLVSNTLEFLDGKGIPRLRIAPPYLVDAVGQRRDATISLPWSHEASTCVADRSPLPPWDRAPTAPCTPGKSTDCVCEVHIEWHDVAVRYPALIDPAWTATADLASPRTGLSLSRLPDGTLLAAGGNGGSWGSFEGRFSERYKYFPDEKMGVWTAAAYMNLPRKRHMATVLKDGAVLLTGGEWFVWAGDTGMDVRLNSAEKYDAATGAWITISPMQLGRCGHTATLLDDDEGRILIAGGSFDDGASTELYRPNDEKFEMGPPMVHARIGHTATLLANGHVFVTGSGDDTVEEFIPAGQGSWKMHFSMSHSRIGHTASTLQDGRVLIAGGWNAHAYANDIELFDPFKADQGMNPWSPGPPMRSPRANHTASTLDDGRILVVGGTDMIGNSNMPAELFFDAGAGLWASAGEVWSFGEPHVAERLPGNAVLVVSGDGFGWAYGSAIFHPAGAGESCLFDGECDSGRCVSGKCCNVLCIGPCLACTASEKGEGSDGICGPTRGQPCAPYACEMSGTWPSGFCKQSCSTDNDCAPGYVCENQACISHCANDERTLGKTDGTSEDCYPYKCKNNACVTHCRSNDDCIDGTCSEHGVCRPLGAEPVNRASCTTRLHGPIDGKAALLGLTLLGLLRLRRRARHHWRRS